MPVMSGPQIVERLAKLGIRPIVVYMSGYADDAISQYRIGDALLLRKPFSPSQLAQMIRNALDRTVAR
jgi:FixJ family two-component response regulator